MEKLQEKDLTLIEDELCDDVSTLVDLSKKIYSDSIKEYENIISHLQRIQATKNTYEIENQELQESIEILLNNCESAKYLLTTLLAIEEGEHEPGEFIFKSSN